MKLVKVKVSLFRNIVDSGWVDIQPDITCLVGKNESGKTTFLKALHRLLPSQGNVSFDTLKHYPAWREKRDRQKGNNLDEVIPIEAVYDIEDSDREYVEEFFGKGIIESKQIKIKRKYDSGIIYYLDVSEKAFVKHVLDSVDFPKGTKGGANKAKSIEDLVEYAEGLSSSEDVEVSKLASTLPKFVSERLNGETLSLAVYKCLKERVPRTLYFSEYSTLPYSVDIQRILTSDASSLTESELTARSLLRLGGADDDYLTNPDYERRKRELENVSNSLTRDIRKYWTQNADLEVQPDITQVTQNLPNNQGRKAVVKELKLRIRDNRHQLTLPFDEHSAGFRWFYSFLAAFSEYEHSSEPLVILLDEPALGLHAKAQSDFLKYIEERLAPRCQVIYTTHSPFMVEPGKLERVRMVEDKSTTQDIDIPGAKVSRDVNSTDADTLFPLQSALGYDLVQHLFIGPNNLVVEGPSDYTYLRVISDYIEALDDGRETLDRQWSIIPVGGGDLIPTFAALLGNHLDVTVMIDSDAKGHPRLAQISNKGILEKSRIITMGGVVGTKEADIEDLFDPEDYIRLYNRTFDKEIEIDDLNGDDPIVRRIARHEGVRRFDHGRPSDELLRNRGEILPTFSEVTLGNFVSLFEAINSTIHV